MTQSWIARFLTSSIFGAAGEISAVVRFEWKYTARPAATMPAIETTMTSFVSRRARNIAICRARESVLCGVRGLSIIFQSG